MPERWSKVRGDGGVPLWVRDLGGRSDRPPLLLHHGLASSQRIWDLMLPDLARRHRVVTFDARGHGGSGKPSTGYGFDHLVADARAVIAACRLRRPVVIGHSWGAMVALELAARHPRSVSGAVLIDGGIFRMRSNFPDWASAKAALAPPHLAGTPVEEFRGMIRTFWGEALEVTPDVERIVLSLMRVRRDGTIRPQLARGNHFRILHAIWEHDPIALHAALQVPSLAILAHGGDATGFDDAKRAAARALAEAGSPTRVSWMRGIHDLPLQHPEAVAARIERFAATAVR
jgi:pimeloyl-ACP methyl ester carboxylesterase